MYLLLVFTGQALLKGRSDRRPETGGAEAERQSEYFQVCTQPAGLSF